MKMGFDQSMIKIRLAALAEWVLADQLEEQEDHAVSFVDLPDGCSVDHLPDGICVAMRVFEEVLKLLSERPERRRLLYIQLESESVCPTSVPRTRKEVEVRLSYSPPSIYVYDAVGPEYEAYEQWPTLIYAEELDIQDVLEGCTCGGQGLAAKYVVCKDRVPWDTGVEYGAVVIVAEPKWLPSDRDLRSR